MNLKHLIERFLNIQRPVFADLDGTLIETISGKTFPETYSDWQLKEGIIQALRNYRATHLHIVTNQGGIEKGFVDEQLWWNKVSVITNLLEGRLNIPITVSMCPYNDVKCPNRKPNPGMLFEYIPSKYTPFDCIMIGDASGKEGQFSNSDKVCAHNAGIKYMDVDDFIEKYS